MENKTVNPIITIKSDENESEQIIFIEDNNGGISKDLLEHIRELPISKYWDLTQEGFAIEVGEMLNGDQNGTTAAVAIRIRWSFALPASAGIPPILPFEEETTIPTSTDTTTSDTTETTTQGTPGFEILIFTLGISIVLIRRKKVIP